MIILGIDPGTATTGFGLVKKEKGHLACLDFGILATSKKDSPAKRLLSLHQQLTALLKRHKPAMMVIEAVFFFKNLKTALPVSEAKGVIMLAGQQQKIKMTQLSPLQVKMSICGYGRAEKIQVQKMVKEILKLKEIPKPDDAADALAIALCWALAGKNQ